MSKYNSSMFATEKAETLPTPTCDWSLLVQPKLPAPEARHFTAGGKEHLFVRNLYETKRMFSLIAYKLWNGLVKSSCFKLLSQHYIRLQQSLVSAEKRERGFV